MHSGRSRDFSDIIRNSFRDVADRFGLTKDNCPKHPSNCTQNWIQQHMDRGATYFILEQEKLAIGCVAMKKANSESFELERLAVLPSYRKRGLGRVLVDHILSEAKRLGSLRVNIGIIAEHTDLKGWYLKARFLEGETKDFPHLPFRVMFMSHDLIKNCQSGKRE